MLASASFQCASKFEFIISDNARVKRKRERSSPIALSHSVSLHNNSKTKIVMVMYKAVFLKETKGSIFRFGLN